MSYNVYSPEVLAFFSGVNSGSKTWNREFKKR